MCASFPAYLVGYRFPAQLRECLESVAQLCEERQSALNVREQLAGDVQLLIDVDTAAPHAIYTDEVFLSRIVTNLLSNALKVRNKWRRLSAT
jgi:signal transduction histidine kinase